jgi:hypothetical protein
MRRTLLYLLALIALTGAVMLWLALFTLYVENA